MNEFKENITKLINSNFLLSKIIEFCNYKNKSLYLVGGTIRDMLLEKNIKDIDLLFIGNVVSEFKDFQNFLIGAQVTFNNKFYTIKINYETELIDIASSRTESYCRSGALPEISVTDKMEFDINRRDFTMNAIAVNINNKSFKIVDLFNGLSSIKGKKISILHDKSFIDDPTRIIRALRFILKLNFKLESNTELLLLKGIKLGALKNISGFRFFRELSFLFDESLNLYQIVCIIKKYHIIEGFTDENIENYNNKLIEINKFVKSNLDNLTIKSKIKLVVLIIFLYKEKPPEFLAFYFEKFGLKKKILKKCRTLTSFSDLYYCVSKNW